MTFWVITSVSPEAAVNLNTNVSFDVSRCSSSVCAQAPLYSGSSGTLLQAVASQLLWFSSNPGTSKENASHQFTVQKYLRPANNILPNNYEESYAVIKPFLINTFFFMLVFMAVFYLQAQTATSTTVQAVLK